VKKSWTPGRPATELFTVVPNISESSVWNLLEITIIGPRILRWLLGFWEKYGHLIYVIININTSDFLEGAKKKIKNTCIPPRQRKRFSIHFN
jgi:hypothetical protein